jgi:hypothetical protein
VFTAIEAHLRRSAVVPVISDFLFADATRLVDELVLVDAVHDVFLLMADVRFAYNLPRVSDGWIEAYDVETGRTGVFSAREMARLGRRAVEWQDRVERHAREAASTSCAWDGSVGNGDGARRVHGRAPVAEGQMMTTERVLIRGLLTALRGRSGACRGPAGSRPGAGSPGRRARASRRAARGS